MGLVWFKFVYRGKAELGIIQNIKARALLSRLKKRIETDASPAAVAELARFYIISGRVGEAYTLLKQYKDVYADSETIKDVWSYILKARAGESVRDAIDAAKNDPTPESFMSVVEAYRVRDDTDAAAEYCGKLISRYPDFAPAYLTMAELRLSRLVNDYSAKDAGAAEAALLKAMELDPGDQDARCLLAGLYYSCALTTKASGLVREILNEAPGHARALEIEELIGSVPLQDEDTDFRFSEIEEKRSFIHEWPKHECGAEPAGADFEAPQQSCADFASFIQKSLDVEGTSAAVFIGHGDGDEAVGAGVCCDGSDWQAFAEFVDTFGKAARKCSLRMDIGALEKCVIEGEENAVILRDLQSGTAAFLADDRNRVNKIYPELRDIVEQTAIVTGSDDEKAAAGTQ